MTVLTKNSRKQDIKVANTPIESQTRSVCPLHRYRDGTPAELLSAFHSEETGATSA